MGVGGGINVRWAFFQGPGCHIQRYVCGMNRRKNFFILLLYYLFRSLEREGWDGLSFNKTFFFKSFTSRICEMKPI